MNERHDYGHHPDMPFGEIERRMMGMYDSELARRIRPIVADVCEQMDNPSRHPVVPRHIWDRMMDEAWRRYRRKYPDYSDHWDDSWHDDYYYNPGDDNYYGTPYSSGKEENNTRDENEKDKEGLKAQPESQPQSELDSTVESQLIFRRRPLPSLIALILLTRLLARRRRVYR